MFPLNLTKDLSENVNVGCIDISVFTHPCMNHCELWRYRTGHLDSLRFSMFLRQCGWKSRQTTNRSHPGVCWRDQLSKRGGSCGQVKTKSHCSLGRLTPNECSVSQPNICVQDLHWFHQTWWKCHRWVRHCYTSHVPLQGRCLSALLFWF